MDIYSRPGSKVRYLDENGYDFDKESCRKAGMKKGDEFTVANTHIRSCSTTVYLKEFPSQGFNSVCFANVPPPHRRVEYTEVEPELAGTAFCNVCEEPFHYDVNKERGFYRREDGLLRLECPKCLARNE